MHEVLTSSIGEPLTQSAFRVVGAILLAWPLPAHTLSRLRL